MVVLVLAASYSGSWSAGILAPIPQQLFIGRAGCMLAREWKYAIQMRKSAASHATMLYINCTGIWPFVSPLYPSVSPSYNIFQAPLGARSHAGNPIRYDIQSCIWQNMGAHVYFLHEWILIGYHCHFESADAGRNRERPSVPDSIIHLALREWALQSVVFILGRDCSCTIPKRIIEFI